MRRTIAVIFATSAMVLMMGVSPAVASPQINVSGTWEYIPTFEFTKVAGSNLFVSGTDVGFWDGTFEGESYEEYVAVFHKSHGTYQGRMEFEGEVDGKFGTLTIKTNGSGPFPLPVDWSGTWVILSGTGELENLHGQGTWWGDLPNLEYEGKAHFSG